VERWSRGTTRRLSSSRQFAASSRTVKVKKKKKIELSGDFKRRGEETQRILRERLEFHAKRRAEREAHEQRPK
jgi:hypothetical protein